MRAGFLILACALLLSSDARAASPSPFLPQSIAFWDAQHGIATFSSCGQKDCLGRIETTADGGRTWTLRAAPPRIGSVTIVRGSGEAWVEAHGGALHSGDQGRTWMRIRRTAGLSGLSFPSHRVGYAVRGRQYELILVKTATAGRSWRTKPLPCGRALGRDALVSFVTPRHGWLLCGSQPSGGGQSKALYQTFDGAKRWRLLGRNNSDLYGSGYARGMNMTASGRGLVWEARGSTYATANGGRRWTPLSTTLPESREASSGWVVSQRTSYLLVWDTTSRDIELVRSSDGARRWQTVRAWPLR